MAAAFGSASADQTQPTNSGRFSILNDKAIIVGVFNGHYVLLNLGDQSVWFQVRINQNELHRFCRIDGKRTPYPQHLTISADLEMGSKFLVCRNILNAELLPVPTYSITGASREQLKHWTLQEFHAPLLGTPGFLNHHFMDHFTGTLLLLLYDELRDYQNKSAVRYDYLSMARYFHCAAYDEWPHKNFRRIFFATFEYMSVKADMYKTECAWQYRRYLRLCSLLDYQLDDPNLDIDKLREAASSCQSLCWDLLRERDNDDGKEYRYVFSRLQDKASTIRVNFFYNGSPRYYPIIDRRSRQLKQQQEQKVQQQQAQQQEQKEQQKQAPSVTMPDVFQPTPVHHAAKAFATPEMPAFATPEVPAAAYASAEVPAAACASAEVPAAACASAEVPAAACASAEVPAAACASAEVPAATYASAEVPAATYASAEVATAADIHSTQVHTVALASPEVLAVPAAAKTADEKEVHSYPAAVSAALNWKQDQPHKEDAVDDDKQPSPKKLKEATFLRQCDVCHLFLDDTCHQRAHSRVHEMALFGTCKECGVVFSRKDDFYEHRALIHENILQSQLQNAGYAFRKSCGFIATTDDAKERLTTYMNDIRNVSTSAKCGSKRKMVLFENGVGHRKKEQKKKTALPKSTKTKTKRGSLNTRKTH